ncbi:hypothetical protein [Fibrella rubiginis]|uniref:hypothetical protein n=1 Tax=Fibrella rubiginis TaxID=2817060 RepID=UPI001E5AE9F3|nr:hypothetical protein [Fibrella rubiginis]
MDAAIGAGLNCVQVTIDWADVQRSDGSYDWTRLDTELNYALAKNMKLMVRVGLDGNRIGNKIWFPEAGYVVDNYGHPYYQDQKVCFSLDHQESVNRAVAFIRVVANHLNDNASYRNNLIGFSLANSKQVETNYGTRNYIGVDASSGERDVEFDWSLPSLIKYRERLKVWFNNSLPAYNNYAASSWSSWDAIMPPTPQASSPPMGYPFPAWRLWYYHRHLSLKEFIEKAYWAAHDVNPLWNLMGEFPHVHVANSPACGTTGARLLLPEWIKGMKLNDDANFDHNLTVNLTLGDRAADKWAAQEVGINSQTEQDCIGHGLNFFKYDGTVFLMAQPMVAGDGSDEAENRKGINKLTNVIAAIRNAYPLDQVPVRRTPVNVGNPVRLSFKLAIGKSYQDGEFSGNYYNKANSGGGNNAVIVSLEDDMLKNP